MGFAKSWGYAGLLMVNRFGWRSTDPKGLLEPEEPCGEGNAYWVRRAVQSSELLIAAWGNGAPDALRGRTHGHTAPETGAYLDACIGDGTAKHLGLTRRGYPKHPLYLRADTEPRSDWPTPDVPCAQCGGDDDHTAGCSVLT